MKEISRGLLSAERDRQRTILKQFEKTLDEANKRADGIEEDITRVKTRITHLEEDLGETGEEES